MSTSTIHPIIEQSLAAFTPKIDQGHLIDELGSINKQIKALTERSDAIKTELKATGLGKASGYVYSALVYASEGRIVTDWRAIAEHFEPSRQMITAYTSQSAPVISVKVTRID